MRQPAGLTTVVFPPHCSPAATAAATEAAATYSSWLHLRAGQRPFCRGGNVLLQRVVIQAGNGQPGLGLIILQLSLSLLQVLLQLGGQPRLLLLLQLLQPLLCPGVMLLQRGNARVQPLPPVF